MSRHTKLRSANTSPTMGVAVEGTRFAYREFGPSTGVPVVFLHHFTAVIDDWDPAVIDGIASERRVITFDNRGVGGTKGRTPTTVSAMADDAIAFIRALGLEQVDLMGFSLGGFISQVIVTKQPALVRRIILAGTGPAGGAWRRQALERDFSATRCTRCSPSKIPSRISSSPGRPTARRRRRPIWTGSGNAPKTA